MLTGLWVLAAILGLAWLAGFGWEMGCMAARLMLGRE